MDSQKQKKFTDLLELGKFYFINQNYEEALKEFALAEKINPKSADLHLHRGFTYEAMNDINSAKAAYGKVLEIDPANRKANEHIEKIVNR